MEERVKVRRLTKGQKVALYKTIRYSHLPHEVLLAAHKNPAFGTEAQDMIMQGLSHKLSPYEKSVEDKEYNIELKPRLSYAKKEEPPKEEAPKEEPPKKDTPKVEAPKDETPKPEDSKVEPQVETPSKPEPPKGEVDLSRDSKQWKDFTQQSDPNDDDKYQAFTNQLRLQQPPANTVEGEDPDFDYGPVVGGILAQSRAPPTNKGPISISTPGFPSSADIVSNHFKKQQQAIERNAQTLVHKSSKQQLLGSAPLTQTMAPRAPVREMFSVVP